MIRREFCVTRMMLLAMLAIMVAGCGEGGAGADQDGPSEEYGKVLRGLKQAALSDSTYGALDQAKELRKAGQLSKAEESTIDAFCLTAWQLVINDEFDRLAKDEYLVARIRNFAEYDISDGYSPDVTAAMRNLRDIIPIAPLTPDLIRGYKKACYR
jgi:hypothetical protein